MRENAALLIVGSGLAGMALAWHHAHLAPGQKIVLIGGAPLRAGSSAYAQGGIAAVLPGSDDHWRQHAEDTLRAGAGLCDPTAVDTILAEAPQAMAQLADWGMHFDQENGRPHLAREGGHSQARVWHRRDHTGRSLMETLLQRCAEQPEIEFREGHRLGRLVPTASGRCTGAILLDRHNRAYWQGAAHTALATGGLGQLYPFTSNPAAANGRGLAEALRAGAQMKDLPYVQFHPTVLAAAPDREGRSVLLSEALRGAGARLVNADGRRFMPGYHPDGELATRDVVALSIAMERKAGRETFLDVRHWPRGQMSTAFPSIAAALEAKNIQPEEELLPVLPGAHYLCGGVATDLAGRTSLSGLYALGECARTGLHGANRLASNSLLEALVMARRTAEHIVQQAPGPPPERPALSALPARMKTEAPEAALRQILQKHLGVVRSGAGLETLRGRLAARLAQLPSYHPQEPYYRLAAAMTAEALGVRENRGCFYRRDRESKAFKQVF